jgi:putative transposase
MRYRRVFQPGGTFFLTLVTLERREVFVTTTAISNLDIAIKKVHAKFPFEVEALVVLPDHLHMIWTLPPGDSNYSTRVRLLKTYFTKLHGNSMPRAKPTASRASKNEQAVWQRRYWEHTICSERDFQTHLDYIHFNPVKHKLVTAARDWTHSTFLSWVEQGVYDMNWGSDDTEDNAVPPIWIGHE